MIPATGYSFVIPAWNEQELIATTIRSIREAANACEIDYEIIVADDGSSDATASIARELGAIVISIDARQISRARNAGAGAAKKSRLIFVDADTTISPAAVRQTIEAFEAGCVAGGALIRFDGRVPLWAKGLLSCLLLPTYRILRLVAGCYLFTTREAFEACGGFNESLFGGEEVDLAWKLKKQGKFRVIRERVTTSGRKLRCYSFGEIMGPLVRGALQGRRFARSRAGFDLWYKPRREDRGP